jgi:hypothetical protein
MVLRGAHAWRQPCRPRRSGKTSGDLVHDREDRSGGAQPQCQRDQSDHRESRAPPHLPQGVLQVLRHPFPNGLAPHIPRRFPHKQFVAKLPACLPFGIARILTALHAVLGSHAKMGADLLVQFPIQPGPAQQSFPLHMSVYPSLPLGSIRLAMAALICFQRERSTASCFFPDGVRL